MNSADAATCAATAALAPVVENVTLASAVALIPVIEDVALVLAVYARPATLIEYVTLSLVIEHIAPALSETCYAPLNISPAYTTESVTTGVNLDTASFDQIAAEEESLERVQLHTVAQIVRVPAPQIQEQIEEQIVDFLVSPIVEKMMEMAQITSQERFQQSIADQIAVVLVPQPALGVSHTALAPVIEDGTPSPAVACSAPAPVIVHVVPAPVVGCVSPAPLVTISSPGQ